MGSALSFRRKRPEPEDPSPEEEPRDAKRVKAAPYVLTVLQSSGCHLKSSPTGCGCADAGDALRDGARDDSRLKP